MPCIRSLTSERCAYIVLLILLLSVIMLMYSYYTKKKLVYIAIVTPSNHQPSFCFECTKSNIYLFCDICLVFDAKYVFLARLANL